VIIILFVYIGGKHDGHLSFWLPAINPLFFLSLHVLLVVGEINILLLLLP